MTIRRRTFDNTLDYLESLLSWRDEVNTILTGVKAMISASEQRLLDRVDLLGTAMSTELGNLKTYLAERDDAADDPTFDAATAKIDATISKLTDAVESLKKVPATGNDTVQSGTSTDTVQSGTGNDTTVSSS